MRKFLLPSFLDSFLFLHCFLYFQSVPVVLLLTIHRKNTAKFRSFFPVPFFLYLLSCLLSSCLPYFLPCIPFSFLYCFLLTMSSLSSSFLCVLPGTFTCKKKKSSLIFFSRLLSLFSLFRPCLPPFLAFFTVLLPSSQHAAGNFPVQTNEKNTSSFLHSSQPPFALASSVSSSFSPFFLAFPLPRSSRRSLS